MVATVDRPGRLTLVEGAGGVLVEIGADGVTLRDLAVDLAAPVLVVVRAGLGTLNHTALTLEALASHNVWCAGLVIGAWPQVPGVVESGQPRRAFARWRRCAPCCRTVQGAFGAAEFESMSSMAFDPQWVRDLAG